MTFGTRLKALREAKGMSKAELARRSGLSANMIGHYEREAHEPALWSLICLADTFKVSLDYLVGRSDRR